MLLRRRNFAGNGSAGSTPNPSKRRIGRRRSPGRRRGERRDVAPQRLHRRRLLFVRHVRRQWRSAGRQILLERLAQRLLALLQRNFLGAADEARRLRRFLFVGCRGGARRNGCTGSSSSGFSARRSEPGPAAPSPAGPARPPRPRPEQRPAASPPRRPEQRSAASPPRRPEVLRRGGSSGRLRGAAAAPVPLPPPVRPARNTGTGWRMARPFGISAGARDSAGRARSERRARKPIMLLPGAGRAARRSRAMMAA